MNKIIFSLAGAVTAVASAIALIDYKKRRDCRPYKEPPVGELMFTLAAAASGALCALIAGQLDETKHPERADKLQKADDKLTELVTPKNEKE